MCGRGVEGWAKLSTDLLGEPCVRTNNYTEQMCPWHVRTAQEIFSSRVSFLTQKDVGKEGKGKFGKTVSNRQASHSSSLVLSVQSVFSFRWICVGLLLRMGRWGRSYSRYSVINYPHLLYRAENAKELSYVKIWVLSLLPSVIAIPNSMYPRPFLGSSCRIAPWSPDLLKNDTK